MIVRGNEYFFHYKYALVHEEEDHVHAWERGVDRVADLVIVPEA